MRGRSTPFASANLGRAGAYLTLTASLDGVPFASESGLRIAPDAALHDVGPIDTLIVPGGATLRTPRVYEEIAEAVRRCSAGCRRIVSVCTGIYGVAPTLSVEQLAARAALSPRQFSRRFSQTFGQTPSERIEALRLDAARDHLTGSSAQVDAIAAAVGFRSDDAFRRAFDRRFGLSPTEYRRRFPPAPLPHPGDCDVDFSLP